MIYILAITVIFLGSALIVCLSEGVQERQEHAQERQRLLALIQFPARPISIPKSPSQDLSSDERRVIAVEYEQQHALANAFAQVGTIVEDNPNVSK
jgi:hypothetical protein